MIFTLDQLFFLDMVGTFFVLSNVFESHPSKPTLTSLFDLIKKWYSWCHFYLCTATPKVFWCFQGYQKGALGRKGLITSRRYAKILKVDCTKKNCKIILFHDNVTLYPNYIYLFKVSNGNTSPMYKICSTLTIKTSEQHQWRRSDVSFANFE